MSDVQSRYAEAVQFQNVIGHLRAQLLPPAGTPLHSLKEVGWGSRGSVENSMKSSGFKCDFKFTDL